MKKNRTVVLLFLAVVIGTALLSDRFLHSVNLENVIRRTSLFGVLSVGAVFVIVTGGIDLAIGSLVCLVGVLLPWLTVSYGWNFWLAGGALLLVSVLAGLSHGLLITRLKIQPFVVTLCGLLLYRGIARGLTADQTQGFGSQFEALRSIATGRIALPGIDGFGLPAPVIVVTLLALFAAFLMHRTIWGRYLKAVGSNAQAAHYSGVPVIAVTVLAYTLCALFSGIGGILFVLDINSAQPADFGSLFELYAIAGAVLGGCSLKGGEISVSGALVGTAVMQVLRNALTLLDVPTQLEYAMIGGVLLLGVGVGQAVTVRWPRRRAAVTAGV